IGCHTCHSIMSWKWLNLRSAWSCCAVALARLALAPSESMYSGICAPMAVIILICRPSSATSAAPTLLESSDHSSLSLLTTSEPGGGGCLYCERFVATSPGVPPTIFPHHSPAPRQWFCRAPPSSQSL